MDVCSSEAEMAMRVLIRDEQELWNLLAAQLQLHKKETLPTIDNVIASILEYKR